MKIALLVLAAILSSTGAHADTWLSLGGVSIHSRPGFNGINPGVGIEHDLSDRSFVAGGVYKNSEFETSKYLGYGRRAPINRAVSAGIIVGAVDGYARSNRDFIPMAAPFLSINGETVGANIIFIPSVFKGMPSALSLQIKVKIKH